MNQTYYELWDKAGCPEDEYGVAVVPENIQPKKIIVNYNAWKDFYKNYYVNWKAL